MGGGNALAAAAADQRVAAAISQVPFLDIVRQAHRSSVRVTVAVLLAAALGRHLPVRRQPRQAALLNAPGAEQGWRRVVAIGEDRAGATASPRAGCSDAHFARSATLPSCIARGWSVSARPIASRGRRRRSRRLDALRLASCASYPDVDHFDIYDGPVHEMLVADQIAFLRRHLLAAPRRRRRGAAQPRGADSLAARAHSSSSRCRRSSSPSSGWKATASMLPSRAATAWPSTLAEHLDAVARARRSTARG